MGNAKCEVRINTIRKLIQKNEKRGGVVRSAWECANSSPFPQRPEEKKRSILLGRQTDTPYMPLAFPRNIILLRTFKAFYIIFHKLCFFKFYHKLCLIQKIFFSLLFENSLYIYLPTGSLFNKALISVQTLFSFWKLSVLPTTPNLSLVTSYNFPVLDLHRVNVNPSQHFHTVD